MVKWRSPFLFFLPMIPIGFLLWTQVALINDSIRVHTDSFDQLMQLRLSELGSYAENAYYPFQSQAIEKIEPNHPFYLMVPKPTTLDTLFTYHSSDPNYSYAKFQFGIPAQMKLQMQFEYLPVKVDLNDSTASPAARWVTQAYQHYLLDEEGLRLADTTLIDTIVQDILLQAGWESEYSIALLSGANHDSLIWAQAGFDSTQARVHQCRLYPSSFLPDLTLAVSLQGQEQFLWTQQWPLFTGAMAMVLLLAVLLIYAIKTIRRQQKLNDLKTDLIHTMTHEFNTPVTNIRLAASQYDPKLPEARRQELLGIVLNENERIGANIKKLLEARQLDAEVLTISPSMQPLHGLIEQVAQAFEPQLQQTGITLETRLKLDPDDVYVDDEHFLNVLANLLDNAIKFSSAGSQITIATQTQGDRFEIAIQDQGIGMNKQQEAQIFDKFYRGDDTRNTHEGFGIGLYYVKHIVTLHQGSITVNSTPNKGSCFTLNLPKSAKR